MTSSQIDPGVPHVPARQVILSAAALWLCYFVLITVRGLVVELGDFTDLLWRRGLVTLAGIIVTVACWPLLRRFDARSLAVRGGAALVIMLPAALALAAVNQWAFAPVEQRIIERFGTQSDPDADDSLTQSGEGIKAGATSTTTTKVTAKGESGQAAVRVRHDLAGNVLVDVLDEGFIPPPPPAPPASVVPPAPPAPPESGQKVSAPSGMSPLLDEDDLEELRSLTDSRTVEALKKAGISQDADGSTVISQPGLYVRQYANGRSEVRTGGKVYTVDETGEIGSIRDDTALTVSPSSAPVPYISITEQKQLHEAARKAAQRAIAKAETARKAALAEARKTRISRTADPAPEPAAREVSQPEPESANSDPAPATVTEDIRGPDHVTIIRQTVQNEGLWRQLTDVALGRYFLLIAWAALYLALGNGEQLRAAEYREGEYRRTAKAAELRSLRYQVNPHFLFNTLNSLSALVMVGRSEQAEKMIQSISRFYRHSLAGDPTTDMPLEDEIALQRHYLEIEAVRFPERLRCEFDVPDDLMSACVPGMILQPLVENSIKYGVSTTIRPVTIRISAREAGGFLILTVADDGPGEGLVSGSTGIGLENVKSRLIARFGEDAKVESGPLPAGGYTTVLTMPVVRHEC